jgi:hypothetical protein
LTSLIRVGGACSRHLLGLLNAFSLLSRAHFTTTRDDPPEIIARGLAGVPVMPLHGKHPSSVTRRLFEVN